MIQKIITAILSLAHVNLSPEDEEKLMQFVKFGIIGVSNTLLSYLLYLLGMFLLPSSLSYRYIFAQIFAYVLSVAWSFYWNNRFVFDRKDSSLLSALLKTYVSYSFTGLFLNPLLLYILVNLGISEYIAPCLRSLYVSRLII